MNLGELIVYNRGKRGWTRADLARKIKMPANSLANLECGIVSNPRFGVICKISTVLNVDMNVFKKCYLSDINQEDFDDEK